MRQIRIFVLVLLGIFAVSVCAMAEKAGPSDARTKNIFQQIKAAADSNKDGKLTVNECMAIYKNKQMAEKNCKYWDADKDGVITEDEYVSQANKKMKR